MELTYHYSTVSEALDDLSEQGFNYDFNLHEKDIKNHPEKYKIVHVYRYEGNTDPGDEAVVYGIKSSSGKKGVFVAGFSANSDNEAAIVLNNIIISSKNRKNPSDSK